MNDRLATGRPSSDHGATVNRRDGPHLASRGGSILERAQKAALGGKYLGAWNDNGIGIATALGQLQALELRERLMGCGALAAGVSGTGPAVAALIPAVLVLEARNAVVPVQTTVYRLREATTLLPPGALAVPRSGASIPPRTVTR